VADRAERAARDGLVHLLDPGYDSGKGVPA
jgi:hypothetical protein